jgi:hypothetical protein
MPFSKLYSVSYDALKFESPDGTVLFYLNDSDHRGMNQIILIDRIASLKGPAWRSAIISPICFKWAGSSGGELGTNRPLKFGRNNESGILIEVH